MDYLSFILLPAVSSFLITGIYKKFFSKLDKPGHRSSHKIPTATSGGVGFVSTIILFSVFLGYEQLSNISILFLASLPLAIMGFIDDRINLSSKFRYIFQVLIIFIMIHICANNGESLLFYYLNINKIFSFSLIVFLIFFGTGFINIINFMDGMDGLIASTTSITFLYLGFVDSHLYFIAFASIFSFIFFNWEPAKIFMGDVGSTFIGGLLISAIFSSSNFIEIVNILLINSPIILDSSICILRRKLNSQNIFKPHKLHLYQRLNQNGWSHSSVTMIYLISTLIMTLSVIIDDGLTKTIAFISLIILGIILEKKAAIPLKMASEINNSPKTQQ